MTDTISRPLPNTNIAAQSAEVKGFFDEATNTVTFVVKDPGSASCAIVDSVLDF
ncbi:MAG: MBL fold metallo-hydrolase, partial [Paracoccaceae bacterium]|nr:MBL fold metallo-hydrolase [Paracoccaceae bacterium]